ncbi:MAG: SAM hydrolase/SAM-dependent halogenase family protein, partial [Pseudomonadota bacterium]
ELVLFELGENAVRVAKTLEARIPMVNRFLTPLRLLGHAERGQDARLTGGKMPALRLAGATATTLLLVAILGGVCPVGAQNALPRSGASSRPTIVFMTDFGADNDAVPICKGVIFGIAPDVRIVDLTHQVTPYSILDGARYLAGVTPYYPPGTVFLVVVDPGVGTSRKAVVVKSKRGQYFDLPDNGLMTLVQDRDGLEGARELTNPAWMIGSKLSSTFHGRDIFSPSAAHRARGDDWTQVGPAIPLGELVRLNIPVAKLDQRGASGTILAIDRPFGSLISNVEAAEFAKLGYSHGDKVEVTLGARQVTVPYVKTFGDVPLGQPLLYVDSRGHVGLALNQGNFSKSYHVNPPLPVFIPRKPIDGAR